MSNKKIASFIRSQKGKVVSFLESNNVVAGRSESDVSIAKKLEELVSVDSSARSRFYSLANISYNADGDTGKESIVIETINSSIQKDKIPFTIIDVFIVVVILYLLYLLFLNK